jgi:hypothetical protein
MSSGAVVFAFVERHRHGNHAAVAAFPAGGDSQESGEIGTAKGLRALVAQLDRASDFESEGRRFESVRARQQNQ